MESDDTVLSSVCFGMRLSCGSVYRSLILALIFVLILVSMVYLYEYEYKDKKWII